METSLMNDETRTTALRESEERYRNILDNIEEGYYEVDLAGNYTFLNKSMCRIFGYTQEEILGTSYRKYINHQSGERIFSLFNRMYKEDLPSTTYTYDLTRKDGTIRYTEASASLVKDLAGKATGFRGIVRDVTTRREMEEAIRQSEGKYRTIIEQMEDGYFEVDLAGNFTFVNDAECLNLGYSREELIGMNNRQYTGKETHQIIFKAFNELYRTGIPIKVLEFLLIKKDGTLSINELSVSLIRDAKGHAAGFRGIARDISDRKHAEEALRESEARFRDLAEMLPVVVYEIDVSYQLTYANRKAVELFGYHQEELVGMDSLTMIVPEDRERFMANFLWRSQGEETHINEYMGLRKDGSSFPMLLQSLPIYKQGTLAGFRGIAIDITERKQSEEALKRSEEKYRKIFEEALEGIFQTTPDGRYLSVNPAFARMFGYTTPQELIAAITDIDHQIYVDPEDRAETVRILRDYDKLEGCEVEQYRKDGSRFWVVINARTVRDAMGNILYFEGTNMDITERKKAEEESQRLRVAIEQTGEDIIITDHEGIIQYVNPAFEKITGFSRKEAIGRTSGFLKSGLHDASFYKSLWATIRSGKIWKGRIINRRKDSRLIYEDTTISPLITAAGKLSGYVALKRDVTETVKLESHLRQTQKMEAIGTLAGGIAHDFNNILGAMMGYAELIKFKTQRIRESIPIWNKSSKPATAPGIWSDRS